MKEHIYSTDEYEVKIGDPVVDAEVKASSTSVAIPCEAIPDGEYLVSLEVNGTVVSHRELLAFASGSCTVGDYTLAYSSYAVTVSTTKNNDVVRLKVEPVEVYVTDAMKAAVAKVAPVTPNELPTVEASDKGKFLHTNESTGALEWSEGGGSGGGVLVVTDTDGTLDKTWNEIYDAAENGIPTALRIVDENNILFKWISAVFKESGDEDTFYVDFGIEGVDFDEYATDSANGYPVS